MGVVSVPSYNFVKFCRPGSNPGVAADTPRFSQFGTNPAAISPRIVLPDNGPPSMDYVEHIFANAGNLQLGADANKFTNFAGVGNVTYDGLRINACQLWGGGFKVSAGHYLEEGIIRLDSPFSRLVLGNHTPEPGGVSRGVLDIVNASGSGLVRVGQVTAAEIFERQNFPDVSVPIGSPALPGQLQQYAYYHFYRRFDSGAGLHRSNLVINTTAAAELTSTYGTPDEPGSDQWSNSGVTNQNAFVLWMRAAWDDTPGASLANAPWASPRVFETTVFQPHGDYPLGWIDGQVAGVEWYQLEFADLSLIQGSKLEVRAIAMDSPPNASFDGLWDVDLTEDDWIPCERGELVSLYHDTLGYPAGRYLLLQLRFTPSPVVALSGSTAIFYDSGSGVALRAYSSLVTPTPGDRVPYLIRNSEGQAVEHVPVTPQFAYDVTHQADVGRFECMDGSAITWPNTTQERRVWQLVWPTITTAEADELDVFFANRGGGVEPFFFTDPDGVDHAVFWLGDRLEFTRRAPNIWSLADLTCVEVLDAA